MRTWAHCSHPPPLARPHRNRRADEKPPVRTPTLHARSHRNQGHRRTPCAASSPNAGRPWPGKPRAAKERGEQVWCVRSHALASADFFSGGAVRQQLLARFARARFAAGMRPRACPPSHPKAAARFVSAAKHGSRRQPRVSQTLGAKASWRWPRESSSTCPQGYRCGWS